MTMSYGQFYDGTNTMLGEQPDFQRLRKLHQISHNRSVRSIFDMLCRIQAERLAVGRVEKYT